MEVPPVVQTADRINRRRAGERRGLSPNRFAFEGQRRRCRQRTQNRSVRSCKWPAVETLGEADHGQYLPSATDFLNEDASHAKIGVRRAVWFGSRVDRRTQSGGSQLWRPVRSDDAEWNGRTGHGKCGAAGAQRTGDVAK